MRSVSCLALLAILLVARGVLGQDDRPRYSPPEPAAAARRPPGPLTITELQYQLTSQEDRFSAALPELVRYFEAVRSAKKAEVEPTWNQLRADSPRLRQTTLLYMTGNQAVLQFNEAEKKGLGTFLRGGGLLYAEEIRMSGPTGSLEGQGAGVAGTPFDRQLKALLRDPLVLGDGGARWEPIPKGHPLYAVCFDFADGPPMGGAPEGNVTQLEMLTLGGRVAVIFSDLNISWYWGDPLAVSRDRGLQFGANLIVFAMAQRAAGPGAGAEGR